MIAFIVDSKGHIQGDAASRDINWPHSNNNRSQAFGSFDGSVHSSIALGPDQWFHLSLPDCTLKCSWKTGQGTQKMRGMFRNKAERYLHSDTRCALGCFSKQLIVSCNTAWNDKAMAQWKKSEKFDQALLGASSWLKAMENQ